jgi:hypothetical protein
MIAIEFVVNIGCMNKEGKIEVVSRVLGDYLSDSEGTAYQKLAASVKNLVMEPKYTSITWVSIGFISLSPDKKDFRPLLIMSGDMTWFDSIQYFKKVIGDAGGGIAEPISCGFIDQSRNLRVELENGIVQLRSI